MTADAESPEQAPSITFTEAAAAKLREVIDGNDRPVSGLRLVIVDRTDGEFQHVLGLVEVGAEIRRDVVVETEGFRVYVERRTAPYVNALQIHYEYRGANISGLQYMNPNPLWLDERELLIQEIFDQHINPAIASHGGYVSLLGVEGAAAYVRLGGGCQGCGMADVTLK